MDIQEIRKEVGENSEKGRKEIEEKLKDINKGINTFQESSKEDMQKQFASSNKVIKEVTSELGRIWREDCTDEEKEEYKAQHEVDKARHASEMEGYTPPSSDEGSVAKTKKPKKAKKKPAAVVEEEEVVEETEEEDDTGWSVWEPEAETEPESEPEGGRELPDIPEIFREPIVDTPDPLEIPSLPEIPTIEAPRTNITDRISTLMTQAADATVDATKEVVSATMSGAKEVASIAAGITEKVVSKVRQKSTKGVMPVRPNGLPPMAEWDAYQGAWTIMGRPVQVAAMPEPEIAPPAWSREEVVLTARAIEPTHQQDEGAKSRRSTPFIPELP